MKYVKENTASFSVRALGEVDALVLSWLSYFNYPDSVRGSDGVRICDITCLPPDMYSDAFNPGKSKKLFERLRLSPRFKDTEMFGFVRETDESETKQFSAVTMRLSDGTLFVSFRGTDPSFVGWKENFDLIYRFPLPSQSAALKYLGGVIESNPDAEIYVGGHSKGGNMAVYAASKVKTRDNIKAVYNFDGPGFLRDVSCEGAVKIVPKASFVGMLLEKGRDFTVVKSKNVSLLQHDPFSWEVGERGFKTTKKRTDMSVRLGRAMGKWIDEMGLDERERLIDIVYTALLKLDTRNFNVFFKTAVKQARALGKEHKRLNESDREFFDEKVRRFKYILKHG